jgi:hypothetical protein
MNEASDMEKSGIQNSGGVEVDTQTISGWGVDIDPKNDPTYPYRERDKEDHSGQWRRPGVQDTQVEILQSIEHKWRPAVVGTSTPPRGLSGAVRRLAFRKSESNLLHWLLLMGADRVNTFEGVFQDVARGRMPNYRFLAKFAALVIAVALVAVLTDAVTD